MFEFLQGEQAVAFAGLISFITPITTALVEVVKKTIPKYDTRYSTAVAVLVSIGLSWLTWDITTLDTGMRLWAGLLAGIASSGLYSFGKTTKTALQKPKL